MVSVLIVDDEHVLLDMIAALIQEAGYDAWTATNGRDALRMLASMPHAPAVILADVMMPHLDGVELAKLVKNDTRFRAVPVVLMSAAGRPRDAAVADAFIAKPFDMSHLVSVVQRFAVRP